MPTLTFTLDLAAPLEDLWAFHEDVTVALPKLSPPGSDVRIISADLPARQGQRVEMSVRGPLGVRMKWVANIVEFNPPREVDQTRQASFVDEMAKGPFADWRHEHQMIETSPGKSRLTDIVTYRMPLGPLGRIGDWLLARRQIEAMFRHRHDVTKRELERR